MVGGANKFQIDCTNATTDDNDFVLQCEINDESDAPATGIIVSLPGLTSDISLPFDTIPVTDKSFQLFNKSTNYIDSGIYTLSIVAVNQLQNVTVVNSTFFVEGKLHAIVGLYEIFFINRVEYQCLN